MKSLFDANWYEKCQYKFEYVNREVKELKNKEKLDIYDEIKLNTLLNVLKSPMEYAHRALAIFFGESSESIIKFPIWKENETEGEFKKKIKKPKKLKKQIECENSDILEIYKKLFKDNTCEIFNDMQNDEKHNDINTHYIEIRNTTIFSLYNDSVSEIDSITGLEDPNIVKMSKGSSNLQEHYYEKKYYFYYKGEKIDEVFTFLNKIEGMAKEFVEDIKNYIAMSKNS